MDVFDQAMDYQIGLVRQAVEEYSVEIRDRLRESISDPYPPASEPYSPPHLRTGNLWEGIQTYVTEIPGKEIRVTWLSERAEGNPLVPMFLELGTPVMAPRPYMEPMFIHVRSEFCRVIAFRVGGVPI